MRTGITQPRSPRSRYVIFLCLLAILSCDSFKEDFIKPESQVTFNQTEYYILPGSSIVIDQASIIKESFSNVSLSISQMPARGELLPLDSFLLKYKPVGDFTEGQDQFVFSVFSNGKFLRTQTMTVFMKRHKDDFPCDLYALEDKVKVKPGSSINIRVLNNDRLCGTNSASQQVSIHLKPQYGEGRLDGDSIIVYTPGPEFKGRDEIVYKLTDSTGGLTSYGIITIGDKRIQILDIPSYTRKILFIDDSTGFSLGDRFLYKTTDGGENWIESVYPQDKAFQLADIFFINKNDGFLASSHGPVMRTADGGNSWRFADSRNRFDQNAGYSVYFTSVLTGFISTRVSKPYEETTQHIIYKTVDGAMSWKEVFSTLNEYQYNGLSFVFEDPSTGYAFGENRIFKTTDAGESWKLLFEHDGIFSPLVSVEKNMFMIFRVEMGIHLVQKSNDALSWNPVDTSLGFAHVIAFSPSADLGLMVGWRSFDEHPSEQSVPYESSQFRISKSLDQGETWVPVDLEFIGIPRAVVIPSSNVAYILLSDKLLRYSL